jgi:hypothetical protein
MAGTIIVRTARPFSTITKIDLERGGHPLRVDWINDYGFGKPGVIDRCRDIQIEQFEDGHNGHFWLPVSCRGEVLVGLERSKEGRGYHMLKDVPDVVESYHIITGSVVLNKALKDSDFDLAAKSRKHNEFKNFRLDTKQGPPLRSDPEAVQKRLDDALTDADSKAA